MASSPTPGPDGRLGLPSGGLPSGGRLEPTADDSPFAASFAEIVELLACAADDPGRAAWCAARLRGLHIALPRPRHWVLYLGGVEDIILTPRDLQFWRIHPLMRGSVSVIGTLGPRGGFIWDRRVVALNADGEVFAHELDVSCHIMRVAEDLPSLVSEGVCREYCDLCRDLRAGRSPRIVDVTLEGYAGHPLPLACRSWAPVSVGGVLCAQLPTERVRSAARLRRGDLPDDVLINVLSAATPPSPTSPSSPTLSSVGRS